MEKARQEERGRQFGRTIPGSLDSGCRLGPADRDAGVAHALDRGGVIGGAGEKVL